MSLTLDKLKGKYEMLPEKEALAKIALNEKKYPVDFSKGNAVKYNRR